MDRQVLRCKNCRLVQYVGARTSCPRCGASLAGVTMRVRKSASATGAVPGLRELPVRERIGKQIAAIRSLLGITRRQACQALGVSHGALAKVELGWYVPTLTLLERLAACYGVSMRTMLDPSLAELTKQDPFIREIAENMEFISADDMELVSEVVKSLKPVGGNGNGRKPNPTKSVPVVGAHTQFGANGNAVRPENGSVHRSNGGPLRQVRHVARGSAKNFEDAQAENDVSRSVYGPN